MATLPGRDLYRATSIVTRELGFAVSSDRPPHLVALYDKQGVLKTYSNLDPPRDVKFQGETSLIEFIHQTL